MVTEQRLTAIGVVLALLFAVSMGLYTTHSDQERREKEEEFVKTVTVLSPVRILEVHYTTAKKGTKFPKYIPWMIVTCEGSNGKRFNIGQEWNSEQVPLVGEVWTIKADRCNYQLDQKL